VSLSIRSMTRDDVPFGLRLGAQAGWNQLEPDWLRFLELQPHGCFVAELDGVPVGTTTTCIFDDVAWVAMVLVDKEMRGRGVGTALMKHALAFLDRCGVRTVRLDATPLGQPIYEKLGFIAEYTLTRFGGVPRPSAPVPDVQPARPEHLPRILELDRSVASTDRRKFMSRLFTEHFEAVRVVERGGSVEGFLMARPGARAWQIGPCLADEHSGPLLLADAQRRYSGQEVFLDIPLENHAAGQIAASMGLTARRQLTRMCRGARPVERVERLWCGSGPEMG
jgi:GNAT superfamily N-acetyltransferase